MKDEYENQGRGGRADMSFMPVTNAVRTKEVFSKEIIKEKNTRYKKKKENGVYT